MDRYAHVEQDELHKALGRVPSLVAAARDGEERGSADEPKCETPGPVEADSNAENCTQNWQYSGDAVSLMLSGLGFDDDALERLHTLRKAFAEMELDAAGHDKSPDGTNGPAWIRTRDRAIMSRLL